MKETKQESIFLVFVFLLVQPTRDGRHGSWEGGGGADELGRQAGGREPGGPQGALLN